MYVYLPILALHGINSQYMNTYIFFLTFRSQINQVNHALYSIIHSDLYHFIVPWL